MTQPKSKEKIESEDAFSRGLFGIPFQHKLESMTDIELATEELHIKGKVAETIIKNEWRRRDKLEQHKLNKELLKIQRNINYSVAFIGVIATLSGAIGGSYIKQNLSEKELMELVQREVKHSLSQTSPKELAHPTDQDEASIVDNDKKEKEVSPQAPNENKQ